ILIVHNKIILYAVLYRRTKYAKCNVTMFQQGDLSKKGQLLDKAKAAREERALTKKKEEAAVKIQALVRGFLSRRRFQHLMLQSLDKLLSDCGAEQTFPKESLRPSLVFYAASQKFLFIHRRQNIKDEEKKVEQMCRYILTSMDSTDPKEWYVSVALSKDHLMGWIQQIKELIWLACQQMKKLKPENPSDAKLLSLYLHMLVKFTSTTTWKIVKVPGAEGLLPSLNQLCANIMGHLVSKGLYPVLKDLLEKGLARSKPSFSKPVLSAIFTVAWRPFIGSNLSPHLTHVFILYIFSVPGLIIHLNKLSPESLAVLKKHKLFSHILTYFDNEDNARNLLTSLDGNYSLCVAANLINLAHLDIEALGGQTAAFSRAVRDLLHHCGSFTGKKKQSATQWHPVLGWYSQPMNKRLNEAMPFVAVQLKMLWGPSVLQTVVLLSLKGAPTDESVTTSNQKMETKGRSFFQKLKLSTSKLSGIKTGKSLNSPEVKLVCEVCGMYLAALSTMKELTRDILTGLSYKELLLPRLWRFMTELGPQGGLHVFQECLPRDLETHPPILSVLVLFCDVASYLIVILDDTEFYSQQIPFHLEDLVSVTGFLNSFVFRMIVNNETDSKSVNTLVFNSTYTLLMILYDRDCRRAFAPPNHWLIREVKSPPCKTYLEVDNNPQGMLIRQMIPHVIPHRDRVQYFRKRVTAEKRAFGYISTDRMQPQSTVVTIHRSRLVEDGYQQLAFLSSQSMKGIIRVKFINEQGLSEAGIDQDGVFKEFLEETISTVFNPSLNLFKTTSEQKLYPSPTSYINENHLALFEFVGKMLGKAVYEGIVVEVPFASFFLNQLLDRNHSAFYSPIDELPSLDLELYNNLTYVKHYDGDIADLDLFFSYDEDCMGKIVTHDLLLGGKVMTVTNDNKIHYIHLMAHFRMCKQIREQTMAFKRGFWSIISPDWLQWFSGPELQRLISGDSADLDLKDLKKNVQYYGGFHGSHRVINWLFDVLEHDFSEKERAQFLKFVTSCSKPPLLGFAHLEPPFSIRCVEVSDDQVR
ncbi:hypothetical protein BSL78_28404, partial [Apostichopus japonicus]